MQTGSGKSCSLKAFDESSSVASPLHILSHLILTTIIKDPILFGEIETWNDYINV